MEKQKIVIVTKNMLGGGAERVIAQLSNYFVACGKNCSIITIDASEIFYQLDPGITVNAIGKKSSYKLLDKIRRYRLVRKMIQQETPNLVLSFPEEIGIYVLLALFGTGIPVYVSERNNPWVMPDAKITRILRKLMYPFARGIIFQTEMAKSFFPGSIQKKGIVLANPIESDRIPRQYTGEREKIIVAAGRLFHQKNFPLLLSAFSQFSSGHPEYKLRIYGEGYMLEELKELCHKHNIHNKVDFPGKSNVLLEKMNSAAMFVLSSDYEGMPNVLLEAMCMGMPVVSTDCPSGGPRELIEDGVNGLLVPVGDETALYEAMERMADPVFARQMADAAYEIREELTSPEIFVSWYRYLFREEPLCPPGQEKS